MSGVALLAGVLTVSGLAGCAVTRVAAGDTKVVFVTPPDREPPRLGSLSEQQEAVVVAVLDLLAFDERSACRELAMQVLEEYWAIGLPLLGLVVLSAVPMSLVAFAAAFLIVVGAYVGGAVDVARGPIIDRHPLRFERLGHRL